MKSLEDLKALREKLQSDIRVRENDGTKIIIGMNYSTLTTLLRIENS